MYSEGITKTQRRCGEERMKKERRANEEGKRGIIIEFYCFIIYRCHKIQTLYDTDKPKSVIRIFQCHITKRNPNDRLGIKRDWTIE